MVTPGSERINLEFKSTNSWKVIEEKRHLQFCHMYLVRQHNERVWHQLHPSHLQRTVLFPSIQKNRKFKKLKSVEDHTCSCNFLHYDSKIQINGYEKKEGCQSLGQSKFTHSNPIIYVNSSYPILKFDILMLACKALKLSVCIFSILFSIHFLKC